MKVRVMRYRGLLDVVEGPLMFQFEGNEGLFSELTSSGELYLDGEHDMTLYLKVDSDNVEVAENDYIVELVDKFDRRYLVISRKEA